MSVNFYPSREKMSEEIKLCTTQKRLDTLQSFCGSCIYRIFEENHVYVCHSCEVQQGKNKIVKSRTPREQVEDEEILGVC